MSIITVGIDLAKNVFAVHGIDGHGKAALVKPKVSREHPKGRFLHWATRTSCPQRPDDGCKISGSLLIMTLFKLAFLLQKNGQTLRSLHAPSVEPSIRRLRNSPQFFVLDFEFRIAIVVMR